MEGTIFVMKSIEIEDHDDANINNCKSNPNFLLVHEHQMIR
jgi:hypothetical protein